MAVTSRSKIPLATQASDQPFSLTDYVQLACMSQRSVEIVIDDDSGSAGIVRIVQGELWSAVDDQGCGPQAWSRLLFAPDRRIQVHTLDATDPGERNLVGHWQHLLMDAARVADEQSRPDIVLSLLDDDAEDSDADERDDTARERFETLVDRGIMALLAKRYDDAYRAFHAADQVAPGDRCVRTNLERLREMGHGLDD